MKSSLDLADNQKAKIFECLQNIDLDQLESIEDITCALPFLTKLLLNQFYSKRKKVLELIYQLKKTTDMVQLLQGKPLEPHELVSNLESNSYSNFESGKPRDKLKIVAIEYLRILDATNQQHGNGTTATEFQKSFILDNPLYVEDVSLCLFALLNRHNNISLLDMIEALLHVKYGPTYILQLVINTPDRCHEVCQSLVTLGDSNEISDNRTTTLRAICQLSPRIGFKVRALTVQLRQVPSMAVILSLDQLNKANDSLTTIEEAVKSESLAPTELVVPMRNYEDNYESALTFVIGLLQDEDEPTRTWFAKFIKNSQQKRNDQNNESILTEFRSQMLVAFKRLFTLFFEDDIIDRIGDFKIDDNESDEQFLNRRLIQATSTLRYFTCLRGIGMLKLNQEESEALLSLITCRLKPTPISVNFFNAGICTLFSCSSIINSHKDERRAADWLKWLLKESDEPSIIDWLNTIAKHFQTNQTNQISESVCSKFGMRLQIKAFISKCKPLFVQDTFNNSLTSEKSVEETDMRKSEVKYQAPIKDWIYQKIFEYDEALRVRMVGIRAKSISSDKIGELKAQLVSCFTNMFDDPGSLVRVVNRILMLPRDEIWAFIDPFMDNWFKVLELDTSSPDFQKSTKALTKMWWRLNTIKPRELWIMTINSLRRVQPQKLYTEVDYTFDDLAHDPLIVLKCDPRVFRNQRMLDIVLHILSAFLEVSKRCLQDQIDEHPNRQKDNRGLEELKSTLVLAQTSAAIQILLEFCIPNEVERIIQDKKEEGCQLDEREKSLLERYDKSVDCICEHLHQVFIVDTNLAKLVHFQTYPSDLLAITIEKVPSMHICLDYIPELLSQPDLPKQVFVIQLTSHLCEKYAITKSLNCAKLCFNVAFTLLQLLPSDKRASFYIPTLPALLRLSRVFPILQEDARMILNQVHQVTLAHMASTSSRLSLGASNPFEGIDKLTWHEVDKLMQGLNLDESLFLCIKKCQLELNGRTC